MPRLESYRRFVAIRPRNIFEGPKFIPRNWKWALTGLHERRSFQQTFVREDRWVTSQKSVCETEQPTLHLFESHLERPVNQAGAGSFNRASSVLCSCEKFREIIYVIVCTEKIYKTKRRHLHCCSSERLKPIHPWPAHTRGAAKDNSVM